MKHAGAHIASASFTPMPPRTPQHFETGQNSARSHWRPQFELSVDFWPASHVPETDRPALLEQAFLALAARFRPDDEMLFGAGMKAAFASYKPKPFYDRLARTEEELVYSHRDEGHQAKLYLKKRDDGLTLPPDQHRVRMETTLNRFGAHALQYGKHGVGIDKVSDLARVGLRRYFGKVFRIVEGPAVREPAKRSERQLTELEEEMSRAWERAGANAFDVRDLQPDASPLAKQAVARRRNLQRPLPMATYRLVRDLKTNDKIGKALHSLDRRLKSIFSRSFPFPAPTAAE